jgi:hypothetical protein
VWPLTGEYFLIKGEYCLIKGISFGEMCLILVTLDYLQALFLLHSKYQRPIAGKLFRQKRMGETNLYAYGSRV